MATAPQTAAAAQTAFATACEAYESKVSAFDASPTTPNRTAVREAAEERALAEERLRLATKRETDAAEGRAAAARQEKLDRLSACAGASSFPAFAEAIAPDLARLRAATTEIAELGPVLKAKALAIARLHDEATHIARQLGLPASDVPPFDGRGWLDTLTRGAVRETAIPHAASSIVDALGGS